MANGQQTDYDGCMPLPSCLEAILFVTGSSPVCLTRLFTETDADFEGSQDVNYESRTRGHGVWQRALAFSFWIASWYEFGIRKQTGAIIERIKL